MEWSDEGVVLSVRPHGETGAIAELLTREHGRHMGLVHGGVGRRLRGVLQPGNKVEAKWRARLSEHLGTYQIDIDKARAGLLMEEPLTLTGLTAACAVAGAIPEREANAGLYEGFDILIDLMATSEVWPAVLVRWELGLLQEMGFGLDLSRCVATGTRDDLVYVSPKSGGAVSREAGEPYRESLFPLPAFLVGRQAGEASDRDVLDGLRITGHFLARHVFGPLDKPLPDARLRLVDKFATLAGNGDEVPDEDR